MTKRSQIVRFAELELDLQSGELRRNGGAPVLLPDQLFRILAALVREPGSLVTRDDLRHELWSTDTFVDFEHSLNAGIKRLREVLGESASAPRFIETIPRRGYRFIAPVELSFSTPPQAGAQPDQSMPPRGVESAASWMKTRVPGRWLAAVLVIAVLVLASALASRSARPVPPGSANPALLRLTSASTLDTDPALSRDGTLVAYASDRGGGDNLDIWIQPVGGGDPMQLTSDPADESEPSFSRDGARVVFSRRGAGIFVIGTTGGEPRQIVQTPWGRTPRFSPDGRWIAYWTGFPASVVAGGIPDALASMFVVSADGGPPQPVQTHLPSARYPVWSPDGEWILFLGEEDTNQKIHDWYVVPAGGGSAIKTGALPALRAAGLPAGIPIPAAWSARGDAVVFATNETDSSNIWQIPITPATGRVSGAPRALTFGTGIERHPTVSESGRIAFTSLVESVDIWRVPLDANAGVVTGPPQRVTDDAASDRLRNVDAEGTRVVFISSRTGRDEVWVRDLATGRERQVTHVGVDDAAATADGREVAFSRSDSGTQRIEIIDTAGGLPETLCQACYGPSDWSRDGARLLFGRGMPSRVSMLDRSSGQEVELTAHPTWSLLMSRFSPDGRWVAFHTTNSPNIRQVHAIPAYGEASLAPEAWLPLVTDHGCHPNWSPDGTLLYHFSFRDGSFCPWTQQIDPATGRPIGEPRIVQHFHHPRLRAASGAAAFNDVHDGYLYLTLTELTGNVWMLDGEPRIRQGSSE